MFTITASPIALALLGFACQGLVSAQSTSSYESSASASSAATSSTTTGPLTHTISVAYGGFTFTPNVIQAEVGDVIEYDFFPPNHSVARAEWGYPCIPYEDTGVDKIGFFSGFKPVDVILEDPPKFQITINDTNPVFYYCTAPNSCIGHQMVGVINPNATTPIATQEQKAKDSSFMLQPGEPWPSEGEADPFTTTASSTHSHTATATATPAATSSAAAVISSSHSGLGAGAIAGIAIGAAAVAILAAALLYMCGRQSRINERNNHPYHQAPQPYNPHMSYVPSHPKHMSVMTASTGYAGPALPGYIPQHDPAMSPPLHPAFPTSDALAAGSDITSPASPAPSQTGVYAAPAYQQLHHQSMPMQQQMYAPAPQGVHEMDTEQGHGIVNFLRKASTRKSGVERYG